MKTLLVLLPLLCITGNLVMAQHIHIPTEGVIEYERKVNMHAVIKRSITKENETYMQMAFDQFKKNQAQFKTQKATLLFSTDKTQYSPIEAQESSTSFFDNFPGAVQPNITFTDFSTGLSTTQKKVFDATFLVKDTLRKINWKITDETREIAGYPCRRANAVIMDSVYVVAFYTDKIPVSGGPESFTGLPGMILGVALPHENITWFATTVTEKPVIINIKPPVKGKATDTKGLIKTLETSLKQWGSFAKIAMKAYLL